MQFENAENQDAKRMKLREVLTVIKYRILSAQFDQNDLFLGNQKIHSWILYANFVLICIQCHITKG